MCDICVFYDEKDRIFVDEEGYRIENIFELITPSDLLLFRTLPGFDVIRVSRSKRIYVDFDYCPFCGETDCDVRIEILPEKEICGYLPRR